MASGSYRQSKVICPYYHRDDGYKRIVCEGLVPDTENHLVFYKRKEYETQMERFCMSDYQTCELCIALDVKYMEEDNENFSS